MKKACGYSWLTVLLTVILFLPSCFFPTGPAYAAEDVTVVVNGVTLYSDVPAMIINGRTFVPMSPIFTALDAQVSWDPVYQEVMGRRGYDVIVLQIGNPQVVVNGIVEEMDVAPFIYSGRTMVPVAFIALSLGEEVSWDPINSIVYIGSSGEPSTFFTEQDAIDRVIYVAALPESVQYLVDSSEFRNGHDYYIIKAFEVVFDGSGYTHASTIGWYYVDQNSGDVYEWDMSDDSIHFLG